ncbi:cation acetate symporter [Arthrobacter sp. B1805]|uniref:solute symporter family protein n=1 Tax=Arthrobacter sp. B1805 TaxID=2058892 RepID=UPI0015E34CEC|nr:cation acetate symporter [Arthrobacter sp. B1805]
MTAVILFAITIAITLLLTYFASRRITSTADHYVAGGNIGGWQNGLAITGDFVSAAAFLGISGAIALSGFNGYYIMLGVPVAFVILLVALAEPLRNLGRFTIADVITSRFDTRRLRSVAASNTLVISIFYMVAQFVGAGVLIQMLFGIDYVYAVLIIGVLMTVYVVFGGMLATTWIQIFQGVLLLIGAFGLAALGLLALGANPFSFFSEVTDAVGFETVTSSVAPKALAGLDLVSMCVATALGIAGLPHMLIRFLTVRDRSAARVSALSAGLFIGLFGLTLPFIGHSAAVLVGQDAIISANAGGNLAAPQLAALVGGDWALGFIAATAFVVIIATLSGLVIACSGAFASDLYANVLKRGQVSEKGQFRAARLSALVISVTALILSLGAQRMNLGFLITLGLCLAASVNLPVLLYTIYWRNFTEIGATFGTLASLVVTISAVLLGPNFMGQSALVPLSNPGIITIPLGFFACWLISVLSRGRPTPGYSFDELTVLSTIGRKITPADP